MKRASHLKFAAAVFGFGLSGIGLAEIAAAAHPDEKGAVVKVVVEAELAPFGPPPRVPKKISRDLVFDRPFFVFLWRDKAAWPYFSAWVGSDEGMRLFAQ